MNISILEHQGLFNGHIYVFDKLGSTNGYLKENILKFKNGDIVLAKAQSRGKGRSQRIWYSSPGKDLTFSMLLSAPLSREIWPNLSQIAALSVALAVNNLPGFFLRSEIKWPNDLLVEGAKLCGILTEIVYSGQDIWILIGLGININSNDQDLQLIGQKSCSLLTLTGLCWHSLRFLQEFLSFYSQYYSKLIRGGFGALLEAWNYYFTKQGSHVYHQDKQGKRQVQVVRTTEKGSLEVLYQGKKEIIYWGELT